MLSVPGGGHYHSARRGLLAWVRPGPAGFHTLPSKGETLSRRSLRPGEAGWRQAQALACCGWCWATDRGPAQPLLHADRGKGLSGRSRSLRSLQEARPLGTRDSGPLHRSRLPSHVTLTPSLPARVRQAQHPRLTEGGAGHSPLCTSEKLTPGYIITSLP